jgi:hypothetical protein
VNTASNRWVPENARNFLTALLYYSIIFVKIPPAHLFSYNSDHISCSLNSLATFIAAVSKAWPLPGSVTPISKNIYSFVSTFIGSVTVDVFGMD